MFAWTSVIRIRTGALVAAAACIAAPAVQADHEINYYPSFFPQEIRIEPLDPDAAAREFVNKADLLHAYLGTAPHFTGPAPEYLKSLASLKSLITVSVNPQSPRMQGRDARCEAIAQAAGALAKQPDVIAHRYPITPYHADYINYIDLVSASKPAASAAALRFRAGEGGAAALLSPQARIDGAAWDVAFGEVAISELTNKAGVAFNAWPAPPWTKDGWFQAYHLLRPGMSDTGSRERADAIFGRLTHRAFKDLAEEINLERDLLAALTQNCERAVVGYRLRNEFYNDDFSNGIEHTLADSQSGFNSSVSVRTVKLKDFPWNGWLRLGIDTRPTAAWNPVAGFTDAPGRLAWSIVGDNGFLPIPYNSRWVSNSAEIRQDDESSSGQSVRIVPETLLPQPGSGKLVAVGPDKSAKARVLYRIMSSAYQDETVPEAADVLYPYALAFRWGSDAKSPTYDPDIAAATQLMRERLRGVRLVKIEERTLAVADLIFHYSSPIVEVYLDNLSPYEQEDALIAPPWSTVPWHALALMEAAVERGIAAFSQSEAKRRGLPWLDLVRDPGQLVKLRGLIKEFAASGYRPAAIETLVDAEAAKARWRLLDKFVEEKGHLLVTNGPYRLKSATPQSMVFDVVREFTYPIGLGTFDAYAYPSRALITGIERAGDRVLIAADAEVTTKQQRDYRVARMPLKPGTLRGTLPIQAVPRYVLIASDGRVAAAGGGARQPDGRFAISLPPALPSGAYTLFTAILLDGNTVNPDIGHIDIRNN